MLESAHPIVQPFNHRMDAFTLSAPSRQVIGPRLDQPWRLGNPGSFLAILWILVVWGPGTFFTDAATTPRKPVTTAYHGTSITDDYQWLENGTNPVVAR